jgi:predicted ATPase
VPAEPPPAPDRGEISRPRFVGRRYELTELSRVHERASAAVVLIEGEAGVGKSRLVREFLDARVLVVEDAHWADETTLEFLLFLVSAQRHDDLTMLVTHRPAEVPDGSPLLLLSSRLPDRVALRRLELGGLSEDEVAGLVASMLGGDAISPESSASRWPIRGRPQRTWSGSSAPLRSPPAYANRPSGLP